MKLSQNKRGVLCALKKGYSIDAEGNVFYKDRKVKLRISSYGYYTFGIRFAETGLPITIRVHQMQAFVKYGEKFLLDNICVRHKNSIPTDNSYDNILIGTHQENMLDKPKKVRVRAATQASSVNRILSDEQMVGFRSDRLSGMSYGQLMKKYNISSKGTISFMVQKSSYFNPIPSSSTEEITPPVDLLIP